MRFCRQKAFYYRGQNVLIKSHWHKCAQCVKRHQNKQTREKTLRQRRKQRLTLTIINVIFIFWWNLPRPPFIRNNNTQIIAIHLRSGAKSFIIIFLSLSDDINSNDEYVFHCYRNREYKLVHLGHHCILQHHFEIRWLIANSQIDLHLHPKIHRRTLRMFQATAWHQSSFVQTAARVHKLCTEITWIQTTVGTRSTTRCNNSNGKIRIKIRKKSHQGRRMGKYTQQCASYAGTRVRVTGCEKKIYSTLKNQKLLRLIMFNILCVYVSCVRMMIMNDVRSDLAVHGITENLTKLRMHASEMRIMIARACAQNAKNDMEDEDETGNVSSASEHIISPSIVCRSHSRECPLRRMESESDKRNHAHVYSNIENGITCRMEHLREKWLVVDDTDDNSKAKSPLAHRQKCVRWSESLYKRWRACWISVKINGPIKKVNKLFAQNGILTTHIVLPIVG